MDTPQEKMIGSLISGRYRVHSHIGSGGMGDIFLADDEIDGRKVCLKMLLDPSESPEEIEYLVQEFRTLKALSHPNLEKVFAYGEVEGVGAPFFSCEYIEGPDLLRTAEDLDFDGLFDCLVQICRGLQFIHSHGLIHFDIKPENVLVPRDERGAPQPKIIDFGLASRRRTEIGEFRGTPAYVAPEILREDPVDHRADLYSLGVTLYRVLTGDYPHSPGSHVEALLERLAAEPPAIHSPRGEVPPALSRITHRLLDKAPERRYPSANHIIEEIARATGKEVAPETSETREGRVLSGRFVGREEETAILERLLTDRAPEPGIALLSGEAGMGKTRMLREFGIRAQTAGWRVFRGEGQETGGEAWSHLQDFFPELVAGLGAGTPLAKTFAPALGRVFPALAGSHPPPQPLQGPAEKLRILEALAHLLLGAAQSRPTAVLLDDLQWADRGTLDALAFLLRMWDRAAREGKPPALLLLGALRTGPEDGEDPVKDFRESMGAGKGPLHLPLMELGKEAVGALVQSAFGVPSIPDHFLDQVLAASRGNPLFVEETVRLLAARGDVRWTGFRWEFPAGKVAVPPPDDLDHILTGVLQNVSEPNRTVLEALSVWGRPAPLGVLSHLEKNRTSESLAEALRNLANLSLVERTAASDGWTWQVRGGLFERFLYSRMQPDRRRDLHARAGRLLEKAGGETEENLERMAHHFLAAELPEKGISLGRKAALRLMDVSQFDRAREILVAANRLAGDAHPLERAEILKDIGQCLMLSGKMKATLGYYRDAADLWEAHGGDRKWLVSLLFLTADVLRLTGDTSGSIETMDRTLRIAEEVGDPEELLRTKLHHGNFLGHVGRVSESRKIVRELLTSHPSLLDTNGGAVGAISLADEAMNRGDEEEAERWLEASVRFADRIGSKHGLAVVHRTRGDWAREVGRFEEALDHFETSLRLSREIGHRKEESFSLEPLIHVHYHTGRYAEAEKVLREGLELGRLLADPLTEIRLGHYEADLCMVRGEIAEALAINERDLQRWAETGHSLWGPLSELNCVFTLVQAGLLRDVPARFRKALPYCRTSGVAKLYAIAEVQVAEYYTARGKYAAVLRALDRSRTGLPRPEAFFQAGVVQSLRAFALARLGRGADADAEGRRAAQTLRGAGMHHDAMTERLRAAIRLREAGDPRASEEVLRALLKETRERGNRAIELSVLSERGETLLHTGDLAGAFAALERAAAMQRGTASRVAAVEIPLRLSFLLEILGDEEGAWNRCAEAEAAVDEVSSLHLLARVRLWKGVLLGRRGSAQEAERSLSEALNAFRRSGNPSGEVEALLELASLAPESDASKELLARAETRSAAQEGGALEVRTALLRARAEAAHGRIEGSLGPLKRALDRALESGDRPAEWESHVALRAAFQRLGRGSEEKLHETSARETEKAMASRLTGRFRETFQGALRSRREALDRSFHPDLAESRTPPPLEAAPRPAYAPGDEETPTKEIRTLRSILEVCQRFNTERKLPDLLRLIMDSAVSIFGAARGLLLLETEGELRVLVSRNLSETGGEEPGISHTIARNVYETGRGVYSGNARTDPAFLESRSVRALDLKSVLCAPLRSGGGIIGTVYLDHPDRENAFGRPDLGLLGALADLAGIAIEDARLLSRLEERTTSLEEQVHTQTLELEEVREQLRLRERELGGRDIYSDIVAQSRPMLDVFDTLDRMTASTLPVVIEGETGTGKELVARAIHYNSPRKARAFVSINCAALPENLLESELFGYKKGAFTGATQESRGLFVHADKGTLFLDEIGDMSTTLQAKLLRALQEGEVRPLGGKASVPVDVRVICATNKVLTELIGRGEFREDLYFRLNVLHVALPPLRERGEDIPLLAAHFLRQFLLSEKRPEKDLVLDTSALGALERYPWPGNVRELKNVVERAAVFAQKKRISTRDLPLEAPRTEEEAADAIEISELDFKESKNLFEKEFLRRALTRHQGNVTRAAEEAGVGRGYFHRLMNKYGISAGDFK
jgi:transcriptional regulator with GAF, ATPase, and Fis domain/tetratricopeptide (TPR) repeat protein